MAAYLTINPPARSQWYDERNRALTGATLLHTSEGVMDTVGPDTGTDNLAAFIRTRTTAGSYHDIADSDSNLELVDLDRAAFHDGTGSNNWALSLSFVCRTVDWARMTAERRAGFLRQGAAAFVRQQQYRKRTGAPLTRLRYITKAQSDAGESGFCCHGWRDPGRRTDPGVTPAALFPFDEFLAACAAALGELMPDHPDAGTAPSPAQQEDTDMRLIQSPGRGIAVIGPGYYRHLNPEEAANAAAITGPAVGGNDRQFDLWRSIALSGVTTSSTAVQLNEAVAKLSGLPAADVDEVALAEALAPRLAGVDPGQVADALRQVLREGVDKPQPPGS